MNRRFLPIIAGALVVGVLVDIPFATSPFPGYAAAIGLFGCIFLILVAKKVLSPLVDRPSSYDGDDAAPDVQPEVWGVRADGTREPGADPDATPAAAELPDDGSGGPPHG